MARCVYLLISIVLIGNSLISAAVINNKLPEDPTLKLIKDEDAEEGVERGVNYPRDYPRDESLLCVDPKTPTNNVKVIEGDPNHLYTKLEVTCDPGMQFTGGKTQVSVECLPLPDPCMCKAAWETLTDYLLVYDFNCTEIRPHQFSKLPENQCHDPTPVNGYLKVLNGSPFIISNITVEIGCEHGQQFPDGTNWKIEICLPASTPIHVTGVWVPDYDVLTCQDPKNNYTGITKDDTNDTNDPPKEEKRFLESLQCTDPKTANNTIKIVKGAPFHMGNELRVMCDPGTKFSNGEVEMNVRCEPVPDPCMCVALWSSLDNFQLVRDFDCKDDLQCSDPTPINGTLKVVQGRPFYLGCQVTLTCDPGFKFPDGASTWNLQCTALPVLPNKVIWIPEVEGHPVCKERPTRPQRQPLRDLDTKDEVVDNNSVRDDPQCPKLTPINGTLKVVRGHPFSYGCNILLTCDPGLVFPDGLHVWNLTCLAVPMPNTVIWVPADKPKPICKESHEIQQNVEDTGNVDGTRNVIIDTQTRSIEDENNEDEQMDRNESEDKQSYKHIASDWNYINSNYNNNDNIELAPSTAEQLEEATNMISEEYEQTYTNENTNHYEENETEEDNGIINENIEDQAEEENEEYEINITDEPIEDNEEAKYEQEEIVEEEESEHNEESINEQQHEEIEEDEEESVYNQLDEDSIEEPINQQEKEEIEEVEEPEHNEENVQEEYIEGEPEETQENGDTIREELEENETEENEEDEHEEEKYEDEHQEGNKEVELEESQEPELEQAEQENEDEHYEENEAEYETEHEHEENDEDSTYEEEEIIEVIPLESPLIRNHQMIEEEIEESFMKPEDEEDFPRPGYDVDVEDVDAPAYLYHIQTQPSRESAMVEQPAESITDICLLPVDSGMAKAHFVRYYFDSTINECKTFVWGGEGGNKNNFENLSSCYMECGNRIQS